MKKIALEDVFDLTTYEKMRRDYRPKIMAIKEKRRIHVGPKVTYLFETYDTMWYQVQEMTRAERIVDDEGIMGELNAYNELIPNKNQFCATMFIEIDDIDDRKSFLSKIVDLPAHTYLKVDAEAISAEFDPRQGSEDKLSSVQYLKYNLTDEQVQAFSKQDSKIALGFDHPEYSFEQDLSSEQKQTLFQDLSAD
jgi:hypothetical protein